MRHGESQYTGRPAGVKIGDEKKGVRMLTATASGLMTAEEFLALPDDPNVERMLIRGRVWEEPKTRRNKWHSSTESLVAYRLWQWKDGRQHDRIRRGGVRPAARS